MMPQSQSDPPRLAEWLVRHLIGDPHWREVTVGDLREELAAIVASDGRWRGRAWYWSQTLRLCGEGTRRLGSRAGATLLSPVRPQGDHLMRSLFLELRPATRALFRQPLATTVIVLTLALGLGSNAAVFGMIDSLILKPFPFADVDRIVMFAENSAEDPFPQEQVAPGNFYEWRDEVDGFTHMAAAFQRDVNLAGSEQQERIAAAVVSAQFFDLLGIAPLRGRVIGDADEVFGDHQQAVVSEGLWQRQFGGDPSIIGRLIHLDGRPYTVIGVVPAPFDFPSGAQLWLPLAFEGNDGDDRGRHFLSVFARLAPGVSFDEAASRMSAIYERQRAEHEGDGRERSLVTRTFTAGMIDIGLVPVLGLWQAAALLVLLIGCANVANLLLARGTARQRELALRLAIGASRWRLVRQLLVESAILAVIATPFALGVAALTFTGLRGALPGELVRYVSGWAEMGVDVQLGAMTLVAALGTAGLFGLLPALQASRPAPVEALKDGGRSVSGGPLRNRLRRGLVVAEIALAVPLLIASGMAALGAQRLGAGPQGYEPDGVLGLRVLLPTTSHPDAAARRTFVNDLLAEAAEIPGVEAVATATSLPSGQSYQRRAIRIDGAPVDPDDAPPLVNYRAVSADYLTVMRMPILRGRGIGSTDRNGSERVTVVSQSLAQRFWPDQNPIGQRIRLGEAEDWTTVVGVVGDVIDDWFIYRNVPTTYVPIDQLPSSGVSLILRTSGDPAALAGTARRAVASVDPTLAPFDVRTMREAIRLRTTGIRLVGGIMAGFGGLALALAAIGVYGVMAYFVAQRRQEIGIRMALGASAREVLLGTVYKGGRMAALGIAIGLALGVLLAQAIESALFGVVSLEPWLFATIAAVLGTSALIASAVPARNAARVDPMVALRND